MNIILIGMPASGKTTLGKFLSKKMKMPFVDSDKIIEQNAKMTITEIFEKQGEKEFRELEHKTCKELSLLDNHIISTGGGIILRKDNMDELKKNALIVFIDRSPKEILRTSALEGRPLLQDKSKLYKLYDERINLYREYAMYTLKKVKRVCKASLKVRNFYKNNYMK